MKKNQTKQSLDGIVRKSGAKPALVSTRHPFGLIRLISRLRKGLLSGLTIVLVVGGIGVVSLLAYPGAVRADMVSQSNWSGGVGTSLGDNEYTSATNVVPGASEVGIGAGSQAAWCNIGTDCNSDWPRRQALMFNNSLGDNTTSYTNYTQKVSVSYMTGMKNDFSDLRFANLAGDQLLAYNLENIINGVSAEAWILIPTLPGGQSSLYMYFGNVSASSLAQSRLVQTDSFYLGQSDPDSLDGWSGTDCTTQIASSAVSLSAGCGFGRVGSFDRAVDRVTEFDYKADLSGVNCGSSNGGAGGGYGDANSIGFTTEGAPNEGLMGFRWLDNEQCGVGTEYYIGYARADGVSQDYDASQGQHLLSNTYYRFRIITHSQGGSDIFYSLNAGISYIQLTPIFSNNPIYIDSGSQLYFHANQFPVSIRRTYAYNQSPLVVAQLGIQEWVGGRVGSLIGVGIDLDVNVLLGDITISKTGGGAVGARMRSSSTSDFSSASDFTACNILMTGSPITDSACVDQDDRYYQYQLLLSDDGTHSIAATGVSIEYVTDNDAPSGASNIVMRKGSGGAIVANGGWFNTGNDRGEQFGQSFGAAPYPYISWDAATDGEGGSGVAGYCLYLGTSSSGDPSQNKGVISGSSPVDVGGACPYAVASPVAELGAITSNHTFTEDTVYYFKVQPIDLFGNLSNTVSQSTFKQDRHSPSIGGIGFGPNGVINTKSFTVFFGASGASDSGGSGIAGYKYCIGTINNNTGFPSCIEDIEHHWYGTSHTGSGALTELSSLTEYLPSVLQGVTTVPADYDRLTFDGVNVVGFAIVDAAQNVYVFAPTVVRLSILSASAPQTLQATPTSSATNAYAFSWTAPATHQGPASDINYCYSVNDPIASDGSNCTWTGQNITQLASGPYATQQGVNTLYLMAKDQTGNFSSANYASVTFTAATTAPGAPQSLDVSDVSVRTSSSWKLAMSWAAPSQSGSGIASYRIYRSTDGTTFSQVGTTSSSNLSFIDTGLSQVLYSYQVKACDNAGNCGLASNTDSRLPTGRFTSAATLTTQPSAVNITTRKATIQWQTDRESDSKVALGTSPGSYGAEETGNSTQATSHTVNLTSLQPGTRYYYVAKWTDQDGNTGTSSEGSFTTAAAPVVGEVVVRDLTVESATVAFKVTGSTSVMLQYGPSPSFGSLEKLNTSTAASSYTIPLAGLSDATKYYYRFILTDNDGNEYSGNLNSFTTPARPRMSNIRRESVEGEPSSTQRFLWNTNVPTTSGLLYTPTGGEQLEALDAKLTTSHSIIIKGLLDNTEYSFVLRSRDLAGNQAVSARDSFRTALDTRAPKISDVVVETAIRGTGADARGQLTIAWKTDEPSTSQVAFGPGQSGEYTGRTYEDSSLTTEHVVIVSDLSTSSVYHFQVISRDQAENQAQSENQSTILGRPTSNVFSIIFDAIARIFGVSNE